MMEINNILHHLFKKPSLEEVPLSSLQELVDRHPYFAAGQLLLSKKLQLQEDAALDAQVQKTNLHFHNPLWLHFNLQQRKQYGSNTSTASPVTELPSENEFNQQREEIRNSSSTDSTVTAQDPEIELLPFAPSEEQAIDLVITAEEKEVIPEKAEITEVQDSWDSGNWEEDPLPEGAEELDADAQEPAWPAPEAVKETPAPAEELKPAPQLSQQWEIKPFKPVISKDELAFDPYHTIDYFASLGIRLSQDPKPDDKLGRQLKSFTAWLKTMRRLPEVTEETIEVNQSDLNAHIEKIASHSLLDREVITQAMAEVLAMQGNKEKSAEIYRKLSLQNPDKSAYFAAKIEELKQY